MTLSIEQRPVPVLPLDWPSRPAEFADLMTPLEAAQDLRLDQTRVHTPLSAVRALNFGATRGCCAR